MVGAGASSQLTAYEPPNARGKGFPWDASIDEYRLSFPQFVPFIGSGMWIFAVFCVLCVSVPERMCVRLYVDTSLCIDRHEHL